MIYWFLFILIMNLHTPDHYGDIIDRHLCEHDWKTNNNNLELLKNLDKNLGKIKDKN